MIVTNKLGLPHGFVAAVDSRPHNATGSLSATTLLKGVKETILTKRHWDEITVDAADRVWAIWGRAVHALLETEGDVEFSEVDVSHNYGELKITGRIDNYNMGNGVIVDYKTASVWKVIMSDFVDWMSQGMIYAWLLRKNGFQADKFRVVALLKDHSKSKAQFDHSYPQSPVFVKEWDVDDKDMELIDEFIREKSSAYLSALDKPDDAIPPCSASERWEDPTKYAIMKKGGKRAVRLFDNHLDAQNALDSGLGDFIDIRPGASKKCVSYCSCCQFCNFYRDHVAVNEGGEA